MPTTRNTVAALCSTLLLVSCAGEPESPPAAQTTPAAAAPVELSLPAGFTASVFAEGVGRGARHIAVDADGDVYVRMDGGDRQTQGRCADAGQPILAFPAHMAPNDLLFYAGEQFPESYRGGAFVAFHGSWNRAPLPQMGYFVAFVPFAEGQPSGEWTTFANGFAGAAEVAEPGDAAHRPCGLALGPDGSLFVSDSVAGTIWRIRHTG